MLFGLVYTLVYLNVVVWVLLWSSEFGCEFYWRLFTNFGLWVCCFGLWYTGVVDFGIGGYVCFVIILRRLFWFAWGLRLFVGLFDCVIVCYG